MALTKKIPEPDYPWDRQPDESMQAFEAFAIYRDMSYQRSLAAVGRKLHKSRTAFGALVSRTRVGQACPSMGCVQRPGVPQRA
jgi:hypothetical protein